MPFSNFTPTMVTLEADGVPPQPLHPTMPPYALRETYLHSSELNFQVEQPSIPMIWDITHLSTKSLVEPMYYLTTTMAISTTTASHDTTLHTLSSPPTASVSTLWQHDHIEIAHGMDRPDASKQHDMQCGTRTQSNNIQPPAMLPNDKSKKQSPTGHHNDLPYQVLGGRPMQPNNTLQAVTPMPNLKHADTMTPFYTKTSEKVTLQLPHHQSNHYCNTANTQTDIGTLASTTIIYHPHTHHCTQKDMTQLTHHPTHVPLTTASVTPCSYMISSATFSHIESQF